MDPTIQHVLNQAFAKTHELWLSNSQRDDAGGSFLAESMRLGFSSAAARQVDLAGGILAQRSVQAQPQSPGGAGFKGVPGQEGG